MVLNVMCYVFETRCISDFIGLLNTTVANERAAFRPQRELVYKLRMAECTHLSRYCIIQINQYSTVYTIIISYISRQPALYTTMPFMVVFNARRYCK